MYVMSSHAAWSRMANGPITQTTNTRYYFFLLLFE